MRRDRPGTRPGLPASLTDLAWLGGLLMLAMFGGLFVWVGSGIGCDTRPCKNPLVLETVGWAVGVALAGAALWTRRPRPLLAAATVALLMPIVRFVVVIAG